MLHPILSRRVNTILYFALWIVVEAIHIAILFLDFHLPFLVCLADAFVFNTLSALFLLSLWFVVRFSNDGTKNIFFLTLIHLGSWMLSTVLLIVFSLFITKALTGSLFVSDYYFSTLSERIIIGLIYYILMVLVYYLIMNYYNLQEKIRNEAQLKNIVKESELNMLKNQINPHFLFNSLNSISSLTLSNPGKAQEMIIKLSEYMRYSLSQRDTIMTTFRSELDNCMRYLEIEKSRFGEKLQFENQIEDVVYDCKLPVMLLQALYENAVKHGVYESTENVVIKTEARFVDDRLFIRIRNTFDPEAAPRKGTGTGLRNIRERLSLLYQASWLVRTDKKDNVFTVEIIIPQ